MSRYKEYLIEHSLPLFWCPGCGNGIILGGVVRALAALSIDRRQTVITTGIGCFGKADDYINTNAAHGTHGRALPIATGVKAYKPELTVLALMGDGDCATIGGNHLIHAARRNIGVTAIVANNRNYGMTGGQMSATTPPGQLTSTSRYGNPENDLDICELARAAGANFVARTTVYHVRQLQSLIEQGIRHPGFSLIEVVSSCPVYYGRFNKLATPAEMMRFWQQATSERDEEGKIRIGVLHVGDRPEFSARYAEVRAQAKQGRVDVDHVSMR